MEFAQPLINEDDHGPLLALTTWFLACALVLCTLIRVVVRYSRQHPPTIDDILVIVATGFAIGGTVSISLAVESGLGKRSRLLTAAATSTIEEWLYAATILYVLTVGVAKLSITVFLARLASSRLHRVLVLILNIVVVSWTIGITMGVAFECQLPRPWEIFTGTCIPLRTFWLSASLVDIVTDLATILIPIHMIWHVQMDSRKKAMVIFIFATRFILPITSAIRVVFIAGFDRRGPDPEFSSVPFGIASQCHAALAIIVACTPAFRPFMDSVRTGFSRTNLAPRNAGTPSNQNLYDVQAVSRPTTQKSSASAPAHELKSKGSNATLQYDPRTESPFPKKNQVYTQKVYSGILNQPFVDVRSNSSAGSNSSPSLTSSPRIPPRPAPPRPPPPPDDLRPHISVFVARSGSPNDGGRRGNGLPSGPRDKTGPNHRRAQERRNWQDLAQEMNEDRYRLLSKEKDFI